jgi:hypothetical protein
MFHALVANSVHITQTAAPAAANESTGSASALLVLAGAGLAMFLTIGAVRTALSVLNTLVSAAVAIGSTIMAIGFGAIVIAVIYVANMVYDFVPI